MGRVGRALGLVSFFQENGSRAVQIEIEQL
jgi:preprotein translocase subunit Sec61beta